MPDLTKSIAEAVAATPREPLGETLAKLSEATGKTAIAMAEAESKRLVSGQGFLESIVNMNIRKAASEMGKRGGVESAKKREREKRRLANNGSAPWEWCIVCQSNGRKGSSSEIARHNHEGHEAMLEQAQRASNQARTEDEQGN